MDGIDRRRVENVLEAARMDAVAELEAASRASSKPDRLTILVVAQWLDSAQAKQTRGPIEIVKAHGLHWGAAGGGGAILLALIQALGQIFRN